MQQASHQGRAPLIVPATQGSDQKQDDTTAILASFQKRVEFLESKDVLHTRTILWVEKMVRNNAANWIRMTISIDTDLAIALSKCQRAHHEKVEQQKRAEPATTTGIKPHIAGDPRPPMLRVFFQHIMAKYDKWQEESKTASPEKKVRIKPEIHEPWVRTLNNLGHAPAGQEEAFFGGYAAQFLWRPMKD